ncbi:t-SNARE [Mycena olivaceomarginata]|nr:t-SNARE [Mycena olivaceomarginata]
MSFQDIATPDAPVSSRSQTESSISLQIFKINANVQGIRSLTEQIGAPRDSSSLRTRLRDLTDATRALVHRASEDMRTLAAQTPHTPAAKKLVSDLDASVRNFQAAQKLSASRQRATAVPVPVLVDITEGATTQTQMQMQTQVVYATEDAFREAEIRDQRNALRELEAGVLDVADIMQSLAHIVEQQGEDLDTIEWNASQTACDLEAGVRELEPAARHQRRARRTCLTIIYAVVCAVVIVAVLL